MATRFLGRRTHGLRAHLVALALAAVVPALGVGGMAAWYAIGSYRDAFEDRLRDSARGLALAIDAEIDSHLTTLAALAASPLLDGGPTSDLATFYMHAKRAADAVHSPVVVVNPDLAQLMTTERPFGEPLPRTNAAETVHAVFENGRPAVSDLLVSAISQRKLAVVVVPVLRDGRTVLVLLTRLEPERLANMLAAQVAASDDTFAALTDAHHRVVARSHEHRRFIGADAPSHWGMAIADSEVAGTGLGRSLDGQEAIYAARRLDRALGWRVGVSEPVAAYRASWQRPLIGLGVGGGIALLAAAFGAAALGRRIILPVDALTQKANAVVEADLTLRDVPPSTVMEFEALRRSIAAADAALRRHAEALATSEQRHRSVVDMAADAIVVTCALGTIQSFNRSAEAIFGYRTEEVIGRSISILLGPEHVGWRDDRTGDFERRSEHISIGREIKGRRKDGSLVSIDLAIAEWRDADGSGYFTGIMRDICARKRAEEALAASERRHRALAEMGAAAIWRAQPDGNITESHGWEVLTGQTQAELVGSGWLSALHADDVVPTVAEWTKACEECRPIDGEYRVRTRHGKYQWHRARAVPILAADGKLVEWIGVVEDVNDRKRAEEALRANEARLRKLLATIDLATVMVRDLDGTICFWSAGCERLYGWTAVEAVGRTTHDLLGTVYPVPLTEIEMALECEGVWAGDLRHRTRGGADLVVAARKVLRRDIDGQPAQVMESVADVTSLYHTEEALRESEGRFREMADTAPVLIWEADSSGACFYFNRPWLDFTGRTAEQEAGIGWADGVHPADHQRCLDIYQGHVARHEPFTMEYRLRRADGTYRWLYDHGVPRRGRDGTFHGFIGSCIDVTERREAEEKLRESEARFGRAVTAARVGTWDWDPASDVIVHSAGREETLIGRPTGSIRNLATMIEAVHPEDRRIVSDAVQRVLDRETEDYEAEYRTLWPDGTVRWLRSIGRAALDPDGAVCCMSGVSMDVTEQVEARLRQALLAREVDHRAKNTLAVVQSMLRLTPIDEPKAFAAAVEGRVAALARAHSLLAEEGWSGADLRAVAERELAPYAAPPGEIAVVSFDGPKLPLFPTAVQPLAMVLHELATNAAKYGALSRPGGRVEVHWRVGRWAGEDGLLRLRWSETGGPAVGCSPTRRGFGSRVIEATIRGQLGGVVDRRWEPAGLVCEINLPLARTTTAVEGGASASIAA